MLNETTARARETETVASKQSRDRISDHVTGPKRLVTILEHLCLHHAVRHETLSSFDSDERHVTACQPITEAVADTRLWPAAEHDE